MWYLKQHRYLHYIICSSSSALASRKFEILSEVFEDKNLAMTRAVELQRTYKEDK